MIEMQEGPHLSKDRRGSFYFERQRKVHYEAETLGSGGLLLDCGKHSRLLVARNGVLAAMGRHGADAAVVRDDVLLVLEEASDFRGYFLSCCRILDGSGQA